MLLLCAEKPERASPGASRARANGGVAECTSSVPRPQRDSVRRVGGAPSVTAAGERRITAAPAAFRNYARGRADRRGDGAPPPSMPLSATVRTEPCGRADRLPTAYAPQHQSRTVGVPPKRRVTAPIATGRSAARAAGGRSSHWSAAAQRTSTRRPSGDHAGAPRRPVVWKIGWLRATACADAPTTTPLR